MKSKQMEITQKKKSNLMTRNNRNECYVGQISWSLLFHPITLVRLVAGSQRRL
jgi:hypothetical protein